MTRKCISCKKNFEIEKEDLAFYKKIGPVINEKKLAIDPPRECPSCREIRRWAYRNQSSLYKAKSALSGEEMISLYPPITEYTVYKENEWWTDKWDPLSYGQEYDFSRPFFEQFFELQKKVPRRALQQDGTNENCEFTTYGTSNKNCYLAFACSVCEDVYYTDWSHQLKDCIDCIKCVGGELLYECVDSNNCYNSMHLKDSNACRESFLLEDCQSCANCICCKNLVEKEYYYFNKKISKPEYQKIVEEAKKDDFKKLEEKFNKWKKSQPARFARIIGSEECTGDNIFKCRNCKKCFDLLLGAENCRYCYFCGGGAKEMYDCNMAGQGSELIYEMQATVGSYNCAFINFCRISKNCYYSDSLGSCDSCFGCIGLNHKNHCILNEQYTEEEYKRLLPKIIEHMRKTGEWGRGFPIKNSPFPFNDTSAYELHPISKEEALTKGYLWNDNKVLPQDESKMTKDVYQCVSCLRKFKMIPHELFFYERMSVNKPKQCFFCRRKERLKNRISYSLFERECVCEESGHGHEGRCKVEFETTYAPDRPEKVYCEDCYQKSII
ncbi:MAG: hypothetical protein OEV37_01735 [Candidatus Berkelbacteria bacterium]|nr:hypothetical protein [Candidatus Berkelbacteria bacterium]